MKAHTLIIRSFAIALLMVLTATWSGAGAWVGVAEDIELKCAGEDIADPSEKDVKHEIKTTRPGDQLLILPSSLLLGQVNTQDGHLPLEHITEVPVPPPEFVR